MLNTRDSVSSAIQTPRISSKILRCVWYFQLSARCLDIPVKQSLMLELLLQVGQHQLKQGYRRLPPPFELVKQILIAYLTVADPGPQSSSIRSATALRVNVGEY